MPTPGKMKPPPRAGAWHLADARLGRWIRSACINPPGQQCIALLLVVLFLPPADADDGKTWQQGCEKPQDSDEENPAWPGFVGKWITLPPCPKKCRLHGISWGSVFGRALNQPLLLKLRLLTRGEFGELVVVHASRMTALGKVLVWPCASRTLRRQPSRSPERSIRLFSSFKLFPYLVPLVDNLCCLPAGQAKGENGDTH